MLKVTWHECKSKQNLIFGLIMILLVFIPTTTTFNGVENITDIYLHILIPSLLYAGIISILNFSDYTNKTIFFLLASPINRLQIFFGKLIFIVGAIIISLLIQSLIAVWIIERTNFLGDIENFNLEIYSRSLLVSISFSAIIILLKQFLTAIFNKWLIVLISLYSASAFIYYVITSALDNQKELYTGSLFRRIMSLIFYPNYILTPYDDQVSLLAIIIISAISIIAIVGAIWRFCKRDFYN